jgi:hypothetical protein
MATSASTRTPLSANTRVTTTIHMTCIAYASFAGQGSTSWARMRARARR